MKAVETDSDEELRKSQPETCISIYNWNVQPDTPKSQPWDLDNHHAVNTLQPGINRGTWRGDEATENDERGIGRIRKRKIAGIRKSQPYSWTDTQQWKSQPGSEHSQPNNLYTHHAVHKPKLRSNIWTWRGKEAHENNEREQDEYTKETQTGWEDHHLKHVVTYTTENYRLASKITAR